MFATSIAAELESHRDMMTDYAVEFADSSARYSRADYLNALVVEGEM